MIDAGILALTLLAQSFEQRGYFENQAVVYPQTAPNDDAHVVDSMMLRWETSYQFAPWFKLSGAVDARTDSHRQTDRSDRVDFDDRGVARPALSMRRLSATIHKGRVTAELGRQFIRWGKTDILTPTDRFAPKDYLSSVVDSDFLGVTAARLTVEAGGDSVDLVYQPWFTPSRTPLLNQRWTVIPPVVSGIGIVDGGASYPGSAQYGVRWNHVGAGYEYALCFFDGENNLPLFNASFNRITGMVTVQRYYPALRLYGGDFAVPTPWVTVKGEAAYFTSSTPNTDEYALYVVQLERQVREWSFVGGYAGEAVTRSSGNPLDFAPDRGFARSFVGRLGFTIDANRDLSVEAAVRAAGSFTRFEYSEAFGQHWRFTGGLAWIRGDMTDFLGEFYRNSYGLLAIRYSF
ncbi:MAG TPA: hypothetical protein VGN17_20165 [Bryobacteraceae bacterium]|jgi:hypothetical protein